GQVEEPELLAALVEDLGAMTGQPLAASAARIAALAPAARVAWLQEALAKTEACPELGAAQLQRLIGVFRANLSASRAYQPREYLGDAVLLRAVDRRGEARGAAVAGWRRLVKGALRVLDVEG